jgi:hypothetical protein
MTETLNLSVHVVASVDICRTYSMHVKNQESQLLVGKQLVCMRTDSVDVYGLVTAICVM